MFKLLTSSILALTTFADINSVMNNLKNLNMEGTPQTIVTPTDESISIINCDSEENQSVLKFDECYLSALEVQTCNDDKALAYIYSGEDCSGAYYEINIPINECFEIDGVEVQFKCNTELYEEIKAFFEYYVKEVGISVVMNIIFLMITLIMIRCCCRPKERLVRDRNMV